MPNSKKTTPVIVSGSSCCFDDFRKPRVWHECTFPLGTSWHAPPRPATNPCNKQGWSTALQTGSCFGVSGLVAYISWNALSSNALTCVLRGSFCDAMVPRSAAGCKRSVPASTFARVASSCARTCVRANILFYVILCYVMLCYKLL